MTIESLEKLSSPGSRELVNVPASAKAFTFNVDDALFQGTA